LIKLRDITKTFCIVWNLRFNDTKQVDLADSFGVKKQYITKLKGKFIKKSKPKKSKPLTKSKPLIIEKEIESIKRKSKPIILESKPFEKIKSKPLEDNGKRLIEISEKLDIVIDLLKEEKPIKRRELPSIPSNRPRTKEDIFKESHKKHIQNEISRGNIDFDKNREFELNNREWLTEYRKNALLVSSELKEVLSKRGKCVEIRTI